MSVLHAPFTRKLKNLQKFKFKNYLQIKVNLENFWVCVAVQTSCSFVLINNTIEIAFGNVRLDVGRQVEQELEPKQKKMTVKN